MWWVSRDSVTARHSQALHELILAANSQFKAAIEIANVTAPGHEYRVGTG